MSLGRPSADFGVTNWRVNEILSAGKIVASKLDVAAVTGTVGTFDVLNVNVLDAKTIGAAGVPGSLSGITTDLQGLGPGVSLNGHTHSIDTTSGSVQSVTTTSVNSIGSGPSIALTNHTHALVLDNTGSVQTVSGATVNNTGTGPGMPFTNHTHALDISGVPGSISGATANTQGAGPGVSLNAHTHALDISGVPGSISGATANTQGVGPGVSLNAHTHALNIVGTPATVTSVTVDTQGAGPGVSLNGHTHALNATGVAAGTYQSVTVDIKGRVTAATTNTVFNGVSSAAVLAVPNVGSVTLATAGVTLTNTPTARVKLDFTCSTNNTAGAARTMTLTANRGGVPIAGQPVFPQRFVAADDNITNTYCWFDNSATVGAVSYTITSVADNTGIQVFLSNFIVTQQ